MPKAPGVSSRSNQGRQYAYDNAAPILCGPDGQDVLFESLQPRSGNQSEGLEALIRKQEVEDWGCVEAEIIGSMRGRMSPLKRHNISRGIKEKITRRAQYFLRLPPDGRAEYLDEMVRVVDAPGPLGGGLQAVRDIDAFEVLGAYAGRLASEAELDRERERSGSNVDIYLFGTASDDLMVSGYQHGNALGVINEGERPEQNNVGFIRLGQHVNFYVALRPIAAGDSMFADYGAAYDRSLLAANPLAESGAMVEQASPARSARLDTPDHPGHAMFLQAREQIEQLEMPGRHIGRLAAALAVSAKIAGLERIDVVVRSGDMLTAVQRSPCTRDHFWDEVASVEVRQASGMPLEQSSGRWPHAMLPSRTDQGEPSRRRK